jgi:uncharacterized membrane protein YphA (DoxX/SURF4 family)
LITWLQVQRTFFCLSEEFFLAGFLSAVAGEKFLTFQPTRRLSRLAAYRRFLAYIAVPAEFFGGIALILGLATRYVVLVMIVFMLVATFSSHRYWEFTDAAARRAQDASFYKNMAMLGGFLFLFVVGSGRLSIDAWLRKR